MFGLIGKDYAQIGLAAVAGLGIIGASKMTTIDIEGDMTAPTRVIIQDRIFGVLDRAICENGTLILHVPTKDWKGPVPNCTLDTIKGKAQSMPGMESIAKRIPSVK